MTDRLPAHVLLGLSAALASRVQGGAAEQNREVVLPATLRVLKGKITAVHAGAPGTVDVQTDGTNSRTNVDCLYSPAVNDIVYVLEQPPLLVVVAKLATF